MGKEARMKEIRKQLRNVVKENIDDVLKTELVSSLQSDLKKQLTERLNSIDTHISSTVKDTMDKLDERSKEVQAYIVRNYTPTPATQPTDTVEIPTPEAVPTPDNG